MGNQYNLKIPPKKLIEDKLLVYILSVREGDGSIDKNNYAVKLAVIDKDFALYFKKVLEDWSGLEVKHYIYNNHSAPHQVILHSKIIATFLRKYNTINKIGKVVTKVKGGKEFLQGQYDSEGSVGDKQITMSNTHKPLLLLCKKLLKGIGIESGGIYIHKKKGTATNLGIYKKDLYRLDIGVKYNLIKFKDLVRFNIKRKQDKLVKELNSYKRK